MNVPSVLLFISVFSGSSAAKAPPPDAVSKAQGVARAFRANQANFHQCSVKYTVKVGEAASLSEASSPDLRFILKADGTYRRDGSKRLLILSVPPDELKAANNRPGAVQPGNDEGVTVVRVLFEPHFLLDDGEKCLSWVPPLGMARAEMGPHYQHRCYLSPFDLGLFGQNERLDPLEAFKQAASDGDKIDFTEQADNQVSVVVQKAKVISRWQFDLARGSFPIRFERQMGDDVVFKWEAAALKQTDSGAWYASDVRRVSWIGISKTYSVMRFEILEMLIGPPPVESFRLTLPAGTPVSHDDMNFPYLRLKAERTISLDNLPDLIKEAEAAKKSRERSEESRLQTLRGKYAPPQANAGTYWRSDTLVVLGACLGIASLGLLVWSSRPNQVKALIPGSAE